MTKTKKQLMNEINDCWEKADDLAISLIIQEARRILREDPHLEEFIMSMGSCCFTAKEGGIYDPNSYNNDDDFEEYIDNGGFIADSHLIIHDYDFESEFMEMVDEMNDKFNSKGYSTRFTANSKEVHEWGDIQKNPIVYEDLDD